jgi:Uma2 family endonuclease
MTTTQSELIVLTGVRWLTYKALALDLAEKPSKKLAYDQGILEIMTPLPEHEISKKLLGRVVELTTEILGLEILSLGSTTWSREDLQRGIEPDECYYILKEALVRGKLDFDLNIDPPPDLAIEIDISSSSLNRLSIYAALGISEIWRFDSRNLFIYVLTDGVYQTRERSQVLPIISRAMLLELLQRRGKIGENALIQDLRKRLQS